MKKFISEKTICTIIVFAFLLSLVPIIYLGLHNYPSGDDFWYGEYTNRAWVQTGSIIEALKGSFRMVQEMYLEWQGTWFTLFLFTLSPNIFTQYGYRIVIFLALGLLIGGTGYLTYYYLVQKLHFTKSSWLIILCTILYPAIQYIPRTTSCLFWFNGIMHYSVPYLLACIAVVQTQKFMEHGKIRNFISLLICFILLGGGSYLMPIAASMIAVLMFLMQIRICKNGTDGKFKIHVPKHNWLILIALVLEIVGLLISFISPGNSVRGGQEFGADPKWALRCIWYAIHRGIHLGIDYFTENPINLLIYIGLGIFLWRIMWNVSKRISFRFPALFVLYMNGIYWAIYTPEIYAQSDVSGGVPNTYFHVFLLVTLANMIYVHGWLQNTLLKHRNAKTDANKRFGKTFTVPSYIFLLIILIIYSNHATVPLTTNDYCIDFVKSGRLEEYIQIREEQYQILTDDTIKNAIVPEFSKDPYPLLLMSLSEDINGSHNLDQAAFYGKETVQAYFNE